MKIEKKSEENNLIICLEGRLDTNTAPELEKELENINGVRNLIFDLENLEYISSAGLRVLLSFQKRMNIQGIMALKNVKESIKEIIYITGFSEIFKII